MLLIIISLIAFLGFLDSTFLTIKHYQGTLPPCSLALGCEKVLTSQYSTIGNVPIALLGAAFYLAVMGISIILLQKKAANFQNTQKTRNISKSANQTIRKSELSDTLISSDSLSILSFPKLLKLLVLLVLSGFIVSVLLFLIQAFVLKSFCQYCIASEIISTILLISSIILIRSK